MKMSKTLNKDNVRVFEHVKISQNLEHFQKSRISEAFKKCQNSKSIFEVGILGGSFNPIHSNHIKIIRIILNKNLADEAWLVPCKKHAFDKELASVKDRLAMIKLAIKGIKRARICCIELKCQGKNYTIDTIRKLKARHKKYKFFLVIGSDILHEIKKWHNYRQLLRETEFIVLKRDGYRIKKVEGMRIKAIIGKGDSKISSTKIREKIKDGRSIKSLVPKSVEKFIKERGLYKK